MWAPNVLDGYQSVNASALLFICESGFPFVIRPTISHALWTGEKSP